jgi:hypothetical protein
MKLNVHFQMHAKLTKFHEDFVKVADYKNAYKWE